MNIVSRIFFLGLAIFGLFTVSWFFVVGLLCYLMSRRSWFFEAVLVGIVMDMLSGMPFGYFLIIMTILLFTSEFLKPFFQEKNIFSVFAIASFTILLFLVLNVAFFLLTSGINLYTYLIFGENLFLGLLYSFFIIFLITGFNFLKSYLRA